jgi:hypothetical protein
LLFLDTLFYKPLYGRKNLARKNPA